MDVVGDRKTALGKDPGRLRQCSVADGTEGGAPHNWWDTVQVIRLLLALLTVSLVRGE